MALRIWGGFMNLPNYPPALESDGLYFSQAIIRVKDHPGLTRKDFMTNHKLAFAHQRCARESGTSRRAKPVSQGVRKWCRRRVTVVLWRASGPYEPSLERALEVAVRSAANARVHYGRRAEG